MSPSNYKFIAFKLNCTINLIKGEDGSADSRRV